MSHEEQQFDAGLELLEQRIDHRFEKRDLLVRALVHRSYRNENEEVPGDNERLEFLGDAVLELIVSYRLLNIFPEMKEGELSRARSRIVRAETLAEVGRGLGLGEILRLGRGELGTGGRGKTTVLADAFEALVGAVYLDSGLDETTRVVEALLADKFCWPAPLLTERDPKSKLQVLVQDQGSPVPVYQLLEETGPPHDKSFTVGVKVDGRQLAVAEGKSKKDAETEAATLALEKLVDDDDSTGLESPGDDG